MRSDAAYAKEFPVSSGSQHRKKGGEGAYGEWVPVEKKGVEKAKALAAVKAAAVVAKAASSGEAASGVPLVVKPVLDGDSVFPEPPLQVRTACVCVSVCVLSVYSSWWFRVCVYMMCVCV